ncbi:MAG TPA: hypothetical protein VHY33_04385 [Thermoanaerobaculia bacterium]|jgi:hypothetical protein|nr:hypothetical protein [Thermoanaerobaculia bacterium]
MDFAKACVMRVNTSYMEVNAFHGDIRDSISQIDIAARSLLLTFRANRANHGLIRHVMIPAHASLDAN